MNKFLYGLIMFCFLCLPVNAFSESITDGMYIAPKVMMSIMTGNDLEKTSHNRYNDTSTRAGGGLALGYDFDKSFDLPIRTELEYIIRDTADFKVNENTIEARHPQTLMVNAYYDIKNSTDFTPYVGVGTGVAFINNKGSWAWNAGTGIAYTISNNWKADLGYRFVHLGKVKNNNYSGNVYSNEVMLATRYTF